MRAEICTQFLGVNFVTSCSLNRFCKNLWWRMGRAFSIDWFSNFVPATEFQGFESMTILKLLDRTISWHDMSVVCSSCLPRVASPCWARRWGWDQRVMKLDIKHLATNSQTASNDASNKKRNKQKASPYLAIQKLKQDCRMIWAYSHTSSWLRRKTATHSKMCHHSLLQKVLNVMAQWKVWKKKFKAARFWLRLPHWCTLDS